MTTNAAYSAYSNYGAGYIVFDGSGVQTLTGTGDGRLPNILINKTGGNPLNLAGGVKVQGSWINTKGNVNAGTSEITFVYTSLIDTGTTQLNKVTLSGGWNSQITRLNTRDLTIANVGYLYYAPGAESGAITVSRDLASSDTAINELSNRVDITLTPGYNGSITSTGGGVFPTGGIIIAKGDSPTLTASVPATAPYAGPVTIKSLGTFNGTFAVAGNVTTHDTAVNSSGNFVFAGTGNQTLAAAVDAGQVPGVVIAKPSGKLTISNANRLSVSGDWTEDSGNAGAVVTTGTTVVLSSAQFKKVDSASTTFNNVVVSMGSSQILTATKMVVGGKLTITSTGVSGIDGTIEAYGDVETDDVDVLGAGKIKFVGGNNQTLSATRALGQVSGVEVAKTGGTLTLSSSNPISVWATGCTPAGPSTPPAT